ncbi:MAG: Uncharacterized protein G01um10147_1041 [Microgenomates group bacterium Gr01-1014_7]|nr:MAG: Uncharacterized protein G01um10147_1041 [Microgenomates group bacterium Gr01-1014_7]
MHNHGCEVVVITCIDYRFQEYINKWIAQNFAPKSFDRVAFAGGVKNIVVILNQIDIAKKNHHIHKVILINHEDCGAYDQEGTPEKHAEDLKTAALKIKEIHPDLEVETYYLHLDGTFEQPVP